MQTEEFLKAQLESWPMAAGNFAALKNVAIKKIEMPGQTIVVQFNPARIVSSGAKVDAASLKARKCFLCAENRPEMQFGIDYGDYTVLINPFPIFPKHLTIPDRRHTDQRIRGRIGDMIRLAGELEGYTVFYNGPRCGASAPDHMHFQAGNSDFLTIGPALESADLQILNEDGDSAIYLVRALPINMFVIDAAKPEEGERLFNRLYNALPVADDEDEPMMNILCYTTAGKTRIVVIPRKKHRPSFYGTEGEGCMLISPASVDMGGVFITPRREDFERIDAGIIRQIIDELCYDKDEIEEVADILID